MAQLIAHLFGDYVAQSTWMALNKSKRMWPCFLHCILYTGCFLPLQPSILAATVIFVTHFAIDRAGLARYVVYVKEWLSPWPIIPWKHCNKTGYLDDEEAQITYLWLPPELARPVWIRVWLTIVADNTMHLAINYLALKYL